MSDNLTQILNQINLTEAYDIYIPSLKSNVKFKPIIIEQYRNFIDSVSNNPYFNVGFQQELTSLIIKNIITDNIDINSLTEIDKLSIAISARINDISSSYNGTDISFLIDKIQQLNLPEQITISKDGVTVTCNVPTIYTESNFNKYAEKNLNEEVKEATALKDIIDLMFVSEIAKCILYIEVEGVKYKQTDNFENWLTAVSNLPISILGEVLKYVDSIKSVKDSLLNISDSNSLTYDLSLFTTV